MAHRDDRDAQRHRIDALERELEEARRRAEKAEKAEQEARERGAQSPRPTREEREEAQSRRAADARWSPSQRRRFTLGAALAVVCADVPVVGLLPRGCGCHAATTTRCSCIPSRPACA